MKYTDYYATLGLAQGASEQDIRKAYRRLAKDYHPDTHPDDLVAEQKFKEISEAYEVLSDKNKRARYDQLGANWNQYQDFSDFGARPSSRHKVEFGSQIFDLNFSDFFETFFGDQANSFWDQHGSTRARNEAKTDTRSEAQADSGEDETADTVSDAAREAVRDAMREANGEAAQAQPDLQYTTEILLEEALTGTRRRIQVWEDNEMHAIDVRIPAGVKDGSKVRVGSKTGNYFLEIKLKPHPQFTVEGNHLRSALRVHEYEALLGASCSVPTLTGTVQMKIPAGSQGGQTFRVRGQGLPDLRQPDQRGDLLVSLEIRIAKNLSAEEKALIERFKALREARPAD